MLYRRRKAALTNASIAPELVLLHGWGRSSIVWDEMLPFLRESFNLTLIDLPGFGGSQHEAVSDLSTSLIAIAEVAPPQAIYLGYSLGGMLAVKMAEQFPERVSALITVASNARFVATEDWSQAMPKKTYQQFYQRVAKNHLAGLKRFSALEILGAELPQALNVLPVIEEDFNPESLLASLDLLASIDNTETLQTLTLPALHILGEKDQLVPALVAEKLAQLNNANIEVLPGAPHGIPVSSPLQLVEEVSRFLQKIAMLAGAGGIDHFQASSQVRDKTDVAKSFSRAASSYDSVAALQRQVGERLLSLLPATGAELVLDMGAGTGHFYPHLQQLFPSASIVGLDLAEGMARYARQQHSLASWLCGDAEALPFADQSIDIIYSSLAVQWCDDYHAVCAEALRVLKPGGRFVFSTLGPNTLIELRRAWEVVDHYVHVNRFSEQSVLEHAIADVGFAAGSPNALVEGTLVKGSLVEGALIEDALIEETVTMEYPELRGLTRELKSLGAHNVNNGRPMGLTGKRRIQAFKAAYEQQRNENGMLPASYQVWYVSLQKPVVEKPVVQNRMLQAATAR